MGRSGPRCCLRAKQPFRRRRHGARARSACKLQTAQGRGDLAGATEVLGQQDPSPRGARSGDRAPDARDRFWAGSGDSNVTVSETHLVMHGLAIKKHATPEAVAGIVGLDVEDVRAALGKLVEAKRVVEARGKFLLAPAARMALDAD